MMHPYCIYVFDSSTANEAALAVKDGQYDSILQYHSSKHNQPTHPHPQGPPPPLSYPQQPPHHHVSPPNAMGGGVPPQAQQPPPTSANMNTQMPMQQPYDPNLSPQKMKERESKLNRLTQLAALASPNLAPAPPQQQQQQQQQQSLPPTTVSQTQPPQQQSQQQHLDPLSSMAAMSECPNMDSYGHTIHHHPPS